MRGLQHLRAHLRAKSNTNRAKRGADITGFTIQCSRLFFCHNVLSNKLVKTFSQAPHIAHHQADAGVFRDQLLRQGCCNPVFNHHRLGQQPDHQGEQGWNGHAHGDIGPIIYWQRMQIARVALRRYQGAAAPQPKAKRGKRQQDDDKPEYWHQELRYSSSRKMALDLVQKHDWGE